VSCYFFLLWEWQTYEDRLLRQICVSCWDRSMSPVEMDLCLLLRQICLLLRWICVSCWDGSVSPVETDLCLLLRRICVSCWGGSVSPVETDLCLIRGPSDLHNLLFCRWMCLKYGRCDVCILLVGMYVSTKGIWRNRFCICFYYYKSLLFSPSHVVPPPHPISVLVVVVHVWDLLSKMLDTGGFSDCGVFP
jgi:hypothetical protein